jgi:phage terminase large subunit-like protein
LRFDVAAADRVLKFFSILHHSKGKWAGQLLKLEPWEQFMLASIFGWKRADGTRRFRTGYIEVARKNGKSLLGAGAALYLLTADHEASAEVYSAATKLAQAKIVWTEAARMARKSPMLRKRLKIFGDLNPKSSSCNINMPATGSKFEPLSADSETMDGLNVSAAIIDEVHAHKTREMWDVLDTATGAREQPLMIGITTAGFDRLSLCGTLNDFTQKVLDRIYDDPVSTDDFFGLIFTLDKDDDWQDESTWIKANPNLGISKKWDDIRRKAERAKQMPAAQNSFLRLELNVWTASETKWMPIEHWRKCANPLFSIETLKGRKCYAGLDLSSTIDVTALVLVFPPLKDGEPYLILPRFWIPEENLKQRVHNDRVPYDVWQRAGWLVATPGNVIDYDFIFMQVLQDSKLFAIEELAFDRWGAARVITVLQGMGLTCVEFGQGFASMSPPMKEVERLVLAHQLEHNANPVMTWMADNLVAATDPAGNIKPDKKRSREKIDGMVAMIMGLDRAMRRVKPLTSVYETRGLTTL